MDARADSRADLDQIFFADSTKTNRFATLNTRPYILPSVFSKRLAKYANPSPFIKRRLLSVNQRLGESTDKNKSFSQPELYYSHYA